MSRVREASNGNRRQFPQLHEYGNQSAQRLHRTSMTIINGHQEAISHCVFSWYTQARRCVLARPASAQTAVSMHEAGWLSLLAKEVVMPGVRAPLQPWYAACRYTSHLTYLAIHHVLRGAEWLGQNW